MLQPTQVSQNQPHARTSTALSATVLNASIPTAVSIVGPITQELSQLRLASTDLLSHVHGF